MTDVSEWVGVGADVFSAVGTVGAFAVAMYLLREEHQREELHDEETRRSQAVKVSAWIEARPLPHGGREIAFHVHNASDMPIFEVSLPMPVPGEDGEPHEAEFIGLVPPGQTIQRSAPKEWAASYFSPEPVEIEFLDSSGQHWTRDEQGVLTRQHDTTAATGQRSIRSRVTPRGRRPARP